MRGVHIKPFAVIATGAVLMPGVIVESDSLVAAGTIVTKNVEKYEVIAGNPGKVISDVRNIKNKITNEPVYPWRDHFKRAMPWKESDFNTWYMSLDNEELKKYKLDFIS